MSTPPNASDREPAQKRCFVISEFGATADAQRHRRHVVKYLIEKALVPLGWTVEPFDTLNEPGQISNQVINRLIEYELVVADLTNLNANVFYELGVRHCARKHVVTLMKKGQKLAFDVSDNRTIFYDLSDPEEVEASVEALEAQARHVETGAEARNIVTIATDVELLRRSENPEANANAEILTRLQEISDALGDRARPLATPRYLPDSKSAELSPVAQTVLLYLTRTELATFSQLHRATGAEDVEVEVAIRRLIQGNAVKHVNRTMGDNSQYRLTEKGKQLALWVEGGKNWIDAGMP